MRTLSVILLCLSLTAFAADPPGNRPIDQAQREEDRGTGRVTDEQTHELNRLEHPDQRAIDEIQNDQERRQRLADQAERKQQDVSHAAIPPNGSVLGPSIGMDVYGGGSSVMPESADRIALASEILAELDRHDQALRDARQKFANDPQKLKRQELALQDEFARNLAGILQNYTVRRTPAPATQPTTTNARPPATRPLIVPSPRLDTRPPTAR